MVKLIYDFEFVDDKEYLLDDSAAVRPVRHYPYGFCNGRS